MYAIPKPKTLTVLVTVTVLIILVTLVTVVISKKSSEHFQTSQPDKAELKKETEPDHPHYKRDEIYLNSLPYEKKELVNYVKKYLLEDPPIGHHPLPMKDQYEISCVTRDQDPEVKGQAPYMTATDLSLEIPDYFYRTSLQNNNIIHKIIPKIQTYEDSIPYDKMGKFQKEQLGMYTIYQTNANTWHKHDLVKNPGAIKNKFDSPFKSVNNGLREFLTTMNNEYMKGWSEKNRRQNVARIGVPVYAMYGHRIVKIEKSENGYYRYYIIGRFFRHNSEIFYEIFIKLIASPNTGTDLTSKLYFEKIEVVGGGTLDKVLMHNPLTEGQTQKAVNPYYKNGGPIINKNNLVDEAIQLLEHNRDLHNELDIKYACFNRDPSYYNNPESPDNYIVFATNKKDCETMKDMYGKPKPYGVWDKPCKHDRECIFYQANRNYPNKFGKCLPSGKCQLPVNMKHMGYHYYAPVKSGKPYCYNCGGKKWKSFTDMGNCCEEQKDKQKYPFLDGPDYAFPNDYNDRYQHYINTKCERKWNAKKNAYDLVCHD